MDRRVSAPLSYADPFSEMQLRMKLIFEACEFRMLTLAGDLVLLQIQDMMRLAEWIDAERSKT